MQKLKIIETFTALTLITLSAVLRLLPHPANFAPISSLALFGGVYLSGALALLLPILAMFVSDIFIGFYQWNLMLVVYLSFLLCVFLGFWLKKNKKWQNVLGCSILAAVLFFLFTNFAVWALTPWYPKNFSGLLECYLMALPFFRNSLLGDIFYTAVFFGTYELVNVWAKRKFQKTEIKYLLQV